MQDFRNGKPKLPDTDSPIRPGDFPLGSPQSRAAARTLLDNFSGEIAPNLLIEFYEPGVRHDDGALEAPVRVDSNLAIVFGGGKPDLRVIRFADESLQTFESRATEIMTSSRGRGKPRGVRFE